MAKVTANTESRDFSGTDKVWKRIFETYEVPEGEEHLIHVIQEAKRFDPETGARLSRPVIQKYGVKTFKFLANTLQGQFSIGLLHKPSSFVAGEKR